MTALVTITFSPTPTTMAAVAPLLSLLASSGASVSLPIVVAPPAATGEAAPVQAGSFMNQTGFAVLDAAGVTKIADPQNASAPYMAALRLMASKPDLSADELLKVTGASTLAGNKAATTKRVQTVLGKVGAVLYRIKDDKVVMADATRQALARHFGFQI